MAREQKLLKQWKQSETKSDTVGHENRQLKKAVHAFQLWSKIPGGLNQNTGASTYHVISFLLFFSRKMTETYV